MKHVIHLSTQDQLIVDEYIAYMSAWTNDQLIKHYQKQYKLGLVGVRRQVLNLIAWSTVFAQRFGFSPVTTTEGTIVDLEPLNLFVTK